MRATVGPGEIIIRDKDKQPELEASGQTEDLAALNRDPDKAYEITRDKHVEIEYYLSDTSVKAALEAGVAITEIMGDLLSRLSEPALSSAIRNHDIDPADAIRQLQSQGCLEQHTQLFNILEWVVPFAHAASCQIKTLSGKVITISDREACLQALVMAFAAQVALPLFHERYEEGLKSGAAAYSQEFVDLVSDPAGLGSSLLKIAGEILYDPVGATGKYGFAIADDMTESALLYVQALAHGDYKAAGEIVARLAANIAIAAATGEAGAAAKSAIIGTRELAALKKIERIERAGAETAMGVTDAVAGAKLNRELLLDEVVDHSFYKHVLQQGEFKGLGIRTTAQFREHVNNVLEKPSSIRYYKDGRQVYLQESTGTVVVRNPTGSGQSTAFQPQDWNAYVSQLPKQTTPY